MSLTQSKILVDDARVIATQWTMAPGSETGQHTHAHDYVVVYLTGGTLTVTTPTGEIKAPVAPHFVTSRAAGISHNVANHTDATITFIEIELK
jgi:beta-alanine degradation protein BauB